MYQIRTIEDYKSAYEESISNPQKFWKRIAENFVWQKPFSKILEYDFKKAKFNWFYDGQVNITENCLDRHLAKNANKTALIFEPNNPQENVKKYTFAELATAVNKAANMLKNLGIKKGDRVCIYLPMLPELMFSVLACARIGAIHSVVFGGFSAEALADRINDANCKLLITSDGANRGGKKIAMKSIADEAVKKTSSIQNVLVVKRTGDKINHNKGLDVDWQTAFETAGETCKPESMHAEDPLFILYTSGSTGKPKGIVHTCGGYMVYVGYTFANVFQYEPEQIYWCGADIGWITGHSYIVYGPLLNAATTLMHEGVPNWPEPDRAWQIIEKHNVNIFYTAPTAIRSFMAAGNAYIKKHTMPSLQVLGSVGEPINVEAWQWYYNKVGHQNCPIADTWWQTENGGITIAPLPGIHDAKPGFASYPLPGIQPVLLSPDGKEIAKNNTEGLLAIKFPWPGMLRTIWNDHQRCIYTYFKKFPGYYLSGDSAKRDADGKYKVIGRVDDVINVSGHRIGTAEVENVINSHTAVVESAVVGFSHNIKGQALFAFLIPEMENRNTSEAQLKQEINQQLTKNIGAIAKVDGIQVVNALPKTRSGKIMRRILRNIVAGNVDELGDTSTLLDPQVIEDLKAKFN